MFSDDDRITVTNLLLDGGFAVLRVSGELDMETEQDLLIHAGRLIGGGHRHLVLDLTALTFCDSRGLNCLLSLNRLCLRMEGRLLLAGVGSRVMRLLTVSGAHQVVACFPTVGHALDAAPATDRPPWPPSPN
ncbi:STAS domain-containing protein [Streptomyces sp. NPDC059176]|uniref:STAS domain-containing protein n=1 Tax=Streptomyces sp. NPDC059176 TaxID=3346758 RepID=UPI0036C58093